MGGLAEALPTLSNLSSMVSEMEQQRQAQASVGSGYDGVSSTKAHRRDRSLHRRQLSISGCRLKRDVGKCRAGNATKLMAVADSMGLPIAVRIADGSRHDVSMVEETLDEVVTDNLPNKLIGDKAFDSAKLAQMLCDQRFVELIAPKRKGTYRRKQDGRSLRRYKRRWKVERLFAWLKRYRRIAMRWEFKAINYLGFVQLAASLIVLKTIAPSSRYLR